MSSIIDNFKVTEFAYFNNSTKGKHGYEPEIGFHAEKKTKELIIGAINIFLHEPDSVNKRDNAPIAVSIGDGNTRGGDRNISLIQIYYMYYRILRRALNYYYTEDTEGLESYLKKQKNYYY